jgi:Domain of unknown function (DU1801)
MQSKATSVGQYLAELPPDRRRAIEAVRKVILANLDRDYEEGMQYGMIGYYVPHRIYPAGYHCDPNQPLPFTALASQKNYLSLYLGCVYCGDVTTDKWFQQAWAKTGKKLDMGKSCIRFKKPEDLALDVIGEAIRRSPVKLYIEQYESVIKTMRKRSSKDGAKAAKAGRKIAAKSKKPTRRKPARASARRAK